MCPEWHVSVFRCPQFLGTWTGLWSEGQSMVCKWTQSKSLIQWFHWVTSDTKPGWVGWWKSPGVLHLERIPHDSAFGAARRTREFWNILIQLHQLNVFDHKHLCSPNTSGSCWSPGLTQGSSSARSLAWPVDCNVSGSMGRLFLRQQEQPVGPSFPPLNWNASRFGLLAES